MKREIKDYLHLYLGCELQWELDKSMLFYFIGIADGGLHLKSSKMTGTITGVSYKDVKLALFPIEYAIKNEIITVENYKPYRKFHITPNHFVSLISEQIDLFGLIESGLAIDKTKPQTHEQR